MLNYSDSWSQSCFSLLRWALSRPWRWSHPGAAEASCQRQGRCLCYKGRQGHISQQVEPWHREVFGGGWRVPVSGWIHTGGRLNYCLMYAKGKTLGAKAWQEPAQQRITALHPDSDLSQFTDHRPQTPACRRGWGPERKGPTPLLQVQTISLPPNVSLKDL